MTRVVMSTSGIPIGRKRNLSADHAIESLDYLNRGYHIAVRDPDSLWSVYAYKANAVDGKPVFVNQPYGTIDAVIVHVYYGNEKAVLYDHPFPQWVNDHLRNLKNVMPPDVHLSTHTTIEGDTDGREPEDDPA